MKGCRETGTLFLAPVITHTCDSRNSRQYESMKSGNRLPLAVAVAVVVAVVAGTFFLRGKSGTGDQAVEESEAPVPVATQVGGPPTGTRQAAKPVDRRQVEDQLSSQVERRAKMRDEHLARTNALREQSAQRYASEQVDPAWAPGKISELTNVANDASFEVAEAQPKSLSIDCRSSMCRIDGQFDDSNKAEDWILLYMASVGGSMPNSVVSRTRNPDGTMRVEIYGRGR